MRDRLKNRTVIIVVIAAGLVGFLLFNGSFRSTVSRFRAIRTVEKDYAKVSADVEKLKSKITSLENNPGSREDLVRRDLGYIRPGEKEIRFVPSSAKEK